jgi:type II secretory pathway pseudopilin PulG
MVAVSILSMLLIVATPTYRRMILKSRTEEAKTMLQAIIFAQERYRQEYGVYYPKGGDEVRNEAEIAKNLKISLSNSNNFNYFITTKRDTGYGGLVNEDGNFTVKVVLRDASWGVCTTSTLTDICKELGTANRESWVSDYNTGENKHFLLFRYPSILNSPNDAPAISDEGYIEGGIYYEYLHSD